MNINSETLDNREYIIRDVYAGLRLAKSNFMALSFLAFGISLYYLFEHKN